MICPNCGEPVRTRHLFCVVCGADLKGIKPEKASVRLRRAFTRQLGGKRQDAALHTDIQAADLHAENPENAVFPDFMRNFT